jgi:hypothetical protein
MCYLHLHLGLLGQLISLRTGIWRRLRYFGVSGDQRRQRGSPYEYWMCIVPPAECPFSIFQDLAVTNHDTRGCLMMLPSGEGCVNPLAGRGKAYGDSMLADFSRLHEPRGSLLDNDAYFDMATWYSVSNLSIPQQTLPVKV